MSERWEDSTVLVLKRSNINWNYLKGLTYVERLGCPVSRLYKLEWFDVVVECSWKPTRLQFINIYIYDCFLSDFLFGFFLLTHVNSQILLHWCVQHILVHSIQANFCNFLVLVSFFFVCLFRFFFVCFLVFLFKWWDVKHGDILCN